MLALSRLNRSSMVTKFGTGVNLDDTVSWTSSVVKVIGHRSRSSGQKTRFSDLSEQMPSPGLWCDVLTSSCDVTTGGPRVVQQYLNIFL